MIVGIDPGNTGAIAFLNKKGKIKCLLDMPIEAKHTGKGQQVSAAGLAATLNGNIKLAVVERVHSMPGQGVTSVFTFGRGLGVIEGVLAAHQIPVVFVSPQKWKGKAHILRKDKDAARTMAMQRHPYLAEELKFKKHIGRADAILIAEFGK